MLTRDVYNDEITTLNILTTVVVVQWSTDPSSNPIEVYSFLL